MFGWVLGGGSVNGDACTCVSTNNLSKDSVCRKTLFNHNREETEPRPGLLCMFSHPKRRMVIMFTLSTVFLTLMDTNSVSL